MNRSAVEHTTESVGGTSESLLQRLGGEAKLDVLVSAFYFNVLNDDRLAYFFAESDVEAILMHQRKFLAFALGGENHYRGRSLDEAPMRFAEDLGLDRHHVEAVVGILAETLRCFGYPDELTRSVVTRVATIADAVIEPGAGHPVRS